MSLPNPLKAARSHQWRADERCPPELPLPDRVRQSIYSRLAGYGDVNDAERLAQDPTFRLISSEKIWEA